jgi:multimeric flavodoxin WrbA
MLDSPPVSAVAFNCSLKSSSEPSSTDRMLDLITESLGDHGVTTTRFRVVDEGVRFGVSSDEGDGDGWPRLLDHVLTASIIVIGTPIWLGHPSSVCQVVLERLDALISETASDGRPLLWDKVAVVGIVGNEDGAHHVTAEVFQALNDCGLTIPAGGAVYWVGEAMGSVDFRDLEEIPDTVRSTAERLAANAAHLARTLAERAYPVPRDA